MGHLFTASPLKSLLPHSPGETTTEVCRESIEKINPSHSESLVHNCADGCYIKGRKERARREERERKKRGKKDRENGERGKVRKGERRKDRRGEARREGGRKRERKKVGEVPKSEPMQG